MPGHTHCSGGGEGDVHTWALTGAPGAWPAVQVRACVNGVCTCKWCVHMQEHKECVHVGVCECPVSVPAQESLGLWNQTNLVSSPPLPLPGALAFFPGKVRMETPSHPVV